jgi:large subunit ribosomal protein L23
MKNLYDIIRRPIITEKSTAHREEGNRVTFEVHRRANKNEIKKAVETLFKVHVVGVRTLTVRARKNAWGATGDIGATGKRRSFN